MFTNYVIEEPVSLEGCEVADFQVVTEQVKAQDRLMQKNMEMLMVGNQPVHRVGKCKRFQGSRQVQEPPSSPPRKAVDWKLARAAVDLNRKAGVVVDWKETQQVVVGWESDLRIS